MKLDMQVLLAQPRGFCAGVDRAIEIVERALDLYGAPVYVLHEIVHNRYVVDDLSRRGVKFIDSLEEVPEGSVTIFSAHGVAEEVVQRGVARKLRVIDATCPLVTKVHLQAQAYRRDGREVVLIGHPGHPEVEGTRGRIDGPVHVLSTVAEVERLVVGDPHKLAYVTQTTLSVDDTREVIDALVRRFPAIKGPELKDICYATQNRQAAVKEIAARCDLLIVVGSGNSSNSVRLVEVGLESGARSAHRIDGVSELREEWLEGVGTVGVTSGASVPEVLVEGVLGWLAERGFGDVEEVTSAEETLVFALPPELRRDIKAAAAT